MKTSDIQNKKTIEVADLDKGNDTSRDAMNRVSTIADNRPQTSAMTQMKGLLENNPRDTAQRREFSESVGGNQSEVPSNQTGMPDHLKAGLENMSGFDLSDVKVHYNSSKPAQLQALAFAQGSEIHLGPGQEKYLPHEGWHVVQQRQGRVKPTMQMKGTAVNDDLGLENEADVMGEKSLSTPLAQRRPEEKKSFQEKQFKKDQVGLPVMSMQKTVGYAGTIQLKEDMWIGAKKYALGTFKKIEKDIGNNRVLSADERLIVSHWMKQEIEFKNVAEFETELATLLQNWDKQKVFYPTTTAVTAAQNQNSTVRMYSARSVDAIDKLYLWATANGITTTGFANYVATRNPAGTALDAPFKAHFGDRAHTIKHWNQKKTAGGVGLISIDLNSTGVTAIEKEKTDENIAKGGEGYVAGKIGLKSEKNFYSAAVGDKKATWDKLVNQIQQITLHEWQP